ASKGGWTTGVTTVDINNDGFMDLYICRSFNDMDERYRRNLLFVNNGDMTFQEKAADYGIDDPRHSTQASFFDYDRDGDLDLFVGNHPRKFTNQIPFTLERRKNPVKEESDMLYRNNGDGTFTDVTDEAGIRNYGFTLGIMTSDINNDGWSDIYVSVDHQEPDYMYINNGDGTFTNQIDDQIRHISNFSMGVDLADFNNDGLLDIIVADMMAEDNYRQKTQMKGMSPEDFWKFTKIGFHYQYMRNTLQMNNGNGSFSEVGQLAGISKTDWSWATLFADFDNDGFKDLLITNGYRRDVRDNDLLIDIKNIRREALQTKTRISTMHLTSLSKATKLTNYLFRNNGDMTFTDVSEVYGLAKPSFSSGAAYGDLDNDGDLDIVISNLADKPFVYRNNLETLQSRNHIRIKLTGSENNPIGIGAKITLSCGEKHQYQEVSLTRGFQSAVEPILHFGLDDCKEVDQLKIQWPDGKEEILIAVKANQLLELQYENAVAPKNKPGSAKVYFTGITNTGFDFTHVENEYDDYKKEILLPHKMSQFGPNIAVGDVNGDGLEDCFIGGASWQAGKLFFQTSSSTFVEANDQPWEVESASEDLGTLLFDADNDNDLDLYVVSGGNEFPENSPILKDRLYLNDGKGNFSRSLDALPEFISSGSCIVAGDYDGDEDLDLFVGGRVVPGKYPFPANSYILRNDKGIFTDVTQEVAPELYQKGLVTSALWTDHDMDGKLDLIVVGEWMPVTVYHNVDGKLLRMTKGSGLDETVGWWNKIVEADIDNDGDPDYIVGNLGLNSKYVASHKEPLRVYCHDFDRSGTLDIVLGYYNQGECYPVRGRQCSSDQMPFLTQKFPDYNSFGQATINDIYGESLDVALSYAATTFASCIIINQGSGKFELKPLPNEAQLSTVYGIIPKDINSDGNIDLLLAGNLFVAEVETGRHDASIGLYLEGDGKGNFEPVHVAKSGFYTPNDVKDLVLIKMANGDELVLVANNNSKVQVIKIPLKAGI
ncbi:MAG: VCBS repeat-containing protein, partial [Bacteroidetes bacterium]|nr:VCBS repeat-containing protein [Bacteroidota bacterium]